MTALAERLHGSWWAPAIPFLHTTSWSLAGGDVAGRIRSSRWSNGGVSVELAGWHGRVGLDTSGLLLMHGASPAPLGRCQHVRDHVRRIDISGQRFDCITSPGHPLRVLDSHGTDVVYLDLARWRRRLTLHLRADIDDELTLLLTALTSVLTIRLLGQRAAGSFP